ncbi:hypothetical protein L596_030899 [Steinernema carpocapsae]|uniref:Uncharacterized protein n=1 Tax=Steinernema carpocapsae TaxID=34508 RepID=A0A4U5MH62_STECR|nr:hypothetical protein L596_030899 [Steinernema carpocapsae]
MKRSLAACFPAPGDLKTHPQAFKGLNSCKTTSKALQKLQNAANSRRRHSLAQILKPAANSPSSDVRIREFRMNLYHAGQQSKAMLEAMQLRDVHLFNMKRRAEAKQKRNSCQTEESVSKRIPLDRDVVLTMQIQLKDHASLLKLDIPHDDDSVLKIRQQLDVLFQFADGSEGPLPNGQPCPGYTNVTIKGPVHKVEEARARLEEPESDLHFGLSDCPKMTTIGAFYDESLSIETFLYPWPNSGYLNIF